MNLFKKKNFSQARDGFFEILEVQKDHLFAFFNYSLVSSLNLCDNPSNKILIKLNEMKSTRFKDYFQFLCKIRSRNLFTLEKHQIPNHLLFQGSPRDKIIDTMKYIDSNRKNFKILKKQAKTIKLQNYYLHERIHCTLFLSSSSMLILVSSLEQISENIRISCYNITSGEKYSELFIKSPSPRRADFFGIYGNEKSLILRIQFTLFLIEINDSLKLLKTEKVDGIVFLKFSRNNLKSFFIAQKDLYIKLVEFPTMKTLETLLIFSIENSQFSCLEIVEKPFSAILLAQEEYIKLYGPLNFPKELKIRGKCPIKSVKFYLKNGKDEIILVLTSNTIELFDLSKKELNSVIAKGIEIENLCDFMVYESKDIILAYDNQLNSIKIKVLSLYDPYLSQNFSLFFCFSIVHPFFIKKDEEIQEFLQILYLDNRGFLKSKLLDISLKYSEFIKRIWEPEYIDSQDNELELQRSYYDGLIDMIEAWKTKDIVKVNEIAENGKFFWDFKPRNEIKTLYFELNKLKKNSKLINESSEEDFFNDINQISAFAFSKTNAIIALSELGTNFIKILEVTHNKIQLKNILEFDYGQNIGILHKDKFLFSENNGKDFYLFHTYNDIHKCKCLGLVIWSLKKNKLIKKQEFNEDSIMETFEFCEDFDFLLCFFQSGKCFQYSLSSDELSEEEYLLQISPYWVKMFRNCGYLGMAIVNDNLLRIYDIKHKELIKLVYLSGESIIFWRFYKDGKLYLLDLNDTLKCFKFSKKMELNNLECENYLFRELRFFDVDEESKDVVAIKEEGAIVIFNLKDKKTKFKYSMESEGGAKAVFWFNYPSTILILGESLTKLLNLYWEWN